MAEIAHKHGGYLLVDGFQTVGALNVDVEKLDIDFMSTGTYKWMLAIKGTGFLYIKEDLIPKLRPALFGWANGPYYDSYRKAGEGWIQGLHASASRFETGSSSIIGFVAAKAAIDFLLNIGMGNVEKRLMTITGYLIDKLQKLGIEIHSPLQPDLRSGNVTFKFRNASEVAQKIRKNGYWIAGGFHYLDGIRASPHFYNTETEVDRLIAELKTFI
jgi:cysteine desulfurase/selenocysteine lyase